MILRRVALFSFLVFGGACYARLLAKVALRIRPMILMT